ncbi:hypothetical protein [Streptomyces sp. NPDC002265]|uniref:hypothetical protein n=1 Tax=unclassified Streptomyces TaxID=2593676 RepID=UPI003319A57F
MPGGTRFRRVVNASGKDDSLVSSDTEERPIKNLKALVEDILARKKKGPVYP